MLLFFFFLKHLIKLLCRESFFRLLRHNLSILNDIRSIAFSLHKFSLIANYGFSLPTRGYALLEAQNVTFFSHWNVNFCHFTYWIDWSFFWYQFLNHWVTVSVPNCLKWTCAIKILRNFHWKTYLFGFLFYFFNGRSDLSLSATFHWLSFWSCTTSVWLTKQKYPNDILNEPPQWMFWQSFL